MEFIRMTEREKEVAALLISGYTNFEIAKMIHITKHTVKAHITRLLKKMNAKNRTHLAYILGRKDFSTVDTVINNK